MLGWSKIKRVYFVIYSVLIGPPFGFFLLLLTLSLFQQKWFLLDDARPIDIAFVAYGLGALQALLTALLIICCYALFSRNIVFNLLCCSVIGWFFGNLVNYDFALRLFAGRQIQFDGDTHLLLFAPLVFGVLMTFLLWYLRPKKWVGP